MMQRVYISGERRYLTFTAKSCRSDAVVVESAGYELTDSATKELISSGVCEINGEEIKILLSTDVPGDYVLTVTVSIPPETVKTRILVTVE